MLLNWENQEYVCKTVEVDIIVSFLLPRITPKNNHCWFYSYSNSAKSIAKNGCVRLMDPVSSNTITKFLRITTLPLLLAARMYHKQRQSRGDGHGSRDITGNSERTRWGEREREREAIKIKLRSQPNVYSFRYSDSLPTIECVHCAFYHQIIINRQPFRNSFLFSLI